MSGELFAALYDTVMWPAERFYLRGLRRELLQAARGRVLEIGAGTGANLPHYPDEVRLVLSEPEWAMLRRAPRDGLPGNPGSPALLASAERLAFPDASFDTVVSTLVLCTVPDQAAALREVRRVLRPGGSFLLIEHVRSLDPAKARLQARLTPGWKRLARGCHLDRDTATALVDAGFQIGSMRRLVPIRIFPLIVAHALPV